MLLDVTDDELFFQFGTDGQSASAMQVGCAAGVESEALQLVDSLQLRLRSIGRQVAAAPVRPRVLSLEGLQPLVLGRSSNSSLLLLLCLYGGQGMYMLFNLCAGKGCEMKDAVMQERYAVLHLFMKSCPSTWFCLLLCSGFGYSQIINKLVLHLFDVFILAVCCYGPHTQPPCNITW